MHTCTHKRLYTHIHTHLTHRRWKRSEQVSERQSKQEVRGLFDTIFQVVCTSNFIKSSRVKWEQNKLQSTVLKKWATIVSVSHSSRFLCCFTVSFQYQVLSLCHLCTYDVLRCAIASPGYNHCCCDYWMRFSYHQLSEDAIIYTLTECAYQY